MFGEISSKMWVLLFSTAQRIIHRLMAKVSG